MASQKGRGQACSQNSGLGGHSRTLAQVTVPLRTSGVVDSRVVEIIQPARVEDRPDRLYVGIRVVTPFRGMLGVRDQLLEEVRRWIDQAAVEPTGYGFLRLHVIDMNGPMDIEAGYFTPQRCDGDERVRPGLMRPGVCDAHLQGSRDASQSRIDRVGTRHGSS